MNTDKAELITRKHIAEVQRNCNQFATRLIDRGMLHDESKFDKTELESLQLLQNVIDVEGQVPYGSKEYKERSEKYLKSMLKHHYENNRHHPEHFQNGVEGMNLLDFVEMIMDWRAASIRDGSEVCNLTLSFDKYKIPFMLQEIVRNYFDSMDWGYK